ncbi:MAG TPA: aldo/keto reductase [bacterium]|nr:aldo/keto reductase [bacterium]
MEYRPYGKTDAKVSVLGFGAMRFAHPEDTEDSAATVLHAFEKGVNYFDTAPGYCEDQSEIIIGRAVVEMIKSGRPFYVSTKSGGKTAGDVRRDLETSLRRLGLETIDFYHCWCVMTLEDWRNRLSGGAVREILKARDEGLIRHSVVSTHLPGPEIHHLLEDGYFEGVTLGYSAINFIYREAGIRAAADRGLGVTVMNPLGGGIIPQNEETFSFIKTNPDQSMVEAGLQFLKAQPGISTLIAGFRNRADVDDAVRAVGQDAPYPAGHMESLRRKLRDHFDRLCTVCTYCRDCPEGIEVWKYMEAANYFMIRASDTPFDRLKWHWDKKIDELDRCTQCRLCEEVCTQRLPILERFGQLRTGKPG